VLVRLPRPLGCGLPVEVWHLGAGEMTPAMRGLLAEHGSGCVDGLAMRRRHPARRLGGWELKCFALLHCAYAEVLLLDAERGCAPAPASGFTTPLGLISFSPVLPRVASPTRQPWALGRNPVGIQSL